MFRSRLVTLVLAASVALTTLAGAAQAVVVRGSLADGGLWRPARPSIDRGDRVVWRAVEGDHNVRAYGRNWSFFRDLQQGDRARKTFRSTGRFKFYCTIHGVVSGRTCDGMCGRVIVG